MSLPKPFYEDGSVTIYHGDAREILPSLGHIDLLLTDPPYGLDCSDTYSSLKGTPAFNAKKGNYGGKKYPKMAGDTEPFDPSHLIGLADKTVLWGADHFSDALPRSRGWLIWDKREELGSNMLSDGELAWTSFPTTTRIFRHKWLGYMRASEVGFHVHPTQKPIALMAWILNEWTDRGMSIVDPYMGSGPTLRAAKDLGRKAIGIELEERYCEIAAERCSQEVLDLGAAA